MSRAFCFSIFAGLTLLANLPAQEGRLNDVRSETQSEPAPRSNSANNNHGGSSWQPDPEYDPLGELAGAGVGYGLFAAVAAPFVIPRHVIRDRNEDLYFPRYPYERGYPGYLAPPTIASPTLAEKWSPDHPPTWWMGRFSIENGNDFNGLNRFQGQFLFDTTWRLGFVTNWDHFDERVARGGGDQTTIGDFTLTYRFAQCERFLMRTGLGFRTLTDDHVTDWGVNFHYGADWFPHEPFVLTGSVDLGSLGNAFVVRTRATVCVTWHGWEAFGGYDLLRIGAVNLHGPMIGVRLWF